MLRWGSHLSVAGGLYKAVEAAAELHLDSLQIFTANQRQWAPRAPDADDIKAFRRAVREGGIKPVVSHASYLINLANADRTAWRRSVAALGAELDRCAALGVPLCVVHPGSHLDTGIDHGIRRIAKALDQIYARRPACTVQTLLETTAGQGTSIGHQFEHLAGIIATAECQRHLGVCVDTCHIHAAGYDLSTESGYERTVAELIRRVGQPRIKCLHVNDSKSAAGSRVDRHAHIGQGTIKRSAFVRLVNDPRFDGIPAILETPKGTNDRGVLWDRVNLRKLRHMVAE